MSSPLISVIIPSYNRPDRTQRAIDSVAAQTYAHIELIVVDDNSTPPLAESLSLPNDCHGAELLTHDENQGASVARNTGINAASGSYLAFLDSDDEWKPEKLARQMDLVEGTDSVVSYTGIERRSADGDLIIRSRATLSGDLSERLLRGNPIGTFSSVVVPTGLVDTAGRLDPQLTHYEDWEWYLRLSEHATFEPVADPLTVKYGGTDPLSRDFRQKREEAYPELRARLRNHAADEHTERLAIAGLQFQMGYSALSNAEYGFARRFFVRSLRTNPKQWKSFAYLLLSGRHVEPFRRLKRALTT